MLNLKILIVMKRLLMLVVLLSISTMAMAQEQEQKLVRRNWYVDAGMKFSSVLTDNVDKMFDMVEEDVTVGYDFNKRWGMYVPLLYSRAHYPKSLTYQEFAFVGLGGKFMYYEIGRARSYIAASAYTSLGQDAWGGAMAYELSLWEEVDDFYYSVGVKYFDPRNSVAPNRWCISASVGVRFGFYKRVK